MRTRGVHGRWIVPAMCAATACGAAGCGSFPRTPADASEAPVDVADAPDGADVDAPDAPPRACNLDLPFGEPMLIPNVNSSAEEFEASLSPDEKTIYIASSRPEGPMGINMFTATRMTATEDFGAVALLANVNSDALDENPTVTRDGRTLYFTSNRDGQGSQLYVATRGAATGDFGAARTVDELNTSLIEGSPYVLGSGNVLYFDSSRDGDRDIYRASRPARATTFNTIERKLDLSLPGEQDLFPVVSDDELTVYFTSSRAPAGDIWEAHRATTAQDFPTPTRVPEPVSSAGEDVPVWLSSDGCRLLLSSNREGRRRLYMASRPPE